MKYKPTVILLSAHAQGGKDFTASILKEELEKKGKKVLVTHYADLLKYICKTFFSWDGQKDEKGRTTLQYVGTDVIRKKNPDYWVEFIKSIITMFHKEWDYILIPDTRFPNEIEVMKSCDEFKTYTIRIDRPGFISNLTEEQKKHPSEIALDDYSFDYYLSNDSTADSLRHKVVKLINSLPEFIIGDNKIQRRTVFCDLDGCVFNTIKCICDMYDEDFKYYPNYTQKHWTTVLSWKFEELELASAEFIDAYFSQQRFFAKVEMFPNAKETLDELSRYYNIVFVSHGTEPNLKLKDIYVKEHFPYAKFIGVNLNEHSDKSSVDMSSKGSVFIDDLKKNLDTSNAATKICFGKSYNWNVDWTGINAFDWKCVKGILLYDED